MPHAACVSMSTAGVWTTVHRPRVLQESRTVRQWENMPPTWWLLHWSGKRNSTRTRKRR